MSCGQLKHSTHSGRKGLEIPDVGNGSGKLNVTHTLTSYLLGSNLNAALLTDLALKANSLILTAKTFPVLSRAKDTLTEKTVTLCLESTVVDGLCLGYLAVGPRADKLRGRKTYFYRIKRILIHSLNCTFLFQVRRRRGTVPSRLPALFIPRRNRSFRRQGRRPRHRRSLHRHLRNHRQSPRPHQTRSFHSGRQRFSQPLQCC